MSQSRSLRRRRRFAASLVVALVGSLLSVTGATAVGTNLSFTKSPPNPATAAVGFPVTVKVQDNAAAALVGVVVTLDIDPAHNPGADVLACTGPGGNVVSSNASGDAVFTGCKINKAASAYQLRARASSATTIFSVGFDVQAGPAHHLNFSVFPAPNTQMLLAPQPVVQVLDAGGNLVASASDAITLTANNHDSEFSCTGTKTKTASAGTASFAGCTQTFIANGYQLTASASGLLPALTPSFNVTSGPPNRLAICWGAALPCNTTPPAPIQGGTAFPMQPVIRVQDAGGNTVVTDNATVVSLAILAGTPSSGGPGTLSCTSSTGTVTNGVLALGGCKIDKVGIGYRLSAAGGGLLTAQTTPFNVVTGAPVALAFSAQPPAVATARSPFPSTVQVAIVDAGANIVATGITATIGLAIANNPGAGSLTCGRGNAATTTGGIATFTGCSINNQANGYTLIASALATAPVTVLTSATSTVINVLAPNAAITLTPSATVITWGADVVLSVHFGTNGGGKPFTIQVSRDAVSWSTIVSPPMATDGSGDASLTYGPSDNRYYRVAFAGAPDLQAGTSPIVRVVVRQTNALRPSPGSSVHTISRGTAILFTSKIRPNRSELPQAIARIVVYQFGASHWTGVLDQMVPVNRDNGVASLQITFNTAGRYYVRSEAVPTAFNANSGWSDLVRYIVK